MKRLYCLILLGTALALKLSAQPWLVVSSPLDTCYQPRDTIRIRWDGGNLNTNMVRMNYSLNAGADWLILNDEGVSVFDPNWGAFPWIAPDSTVDSAIIEVREYNGQVIRFSDYFKIASDCSNYLPGPWILVTAPSPRDTAVAGDTVRVKWSAANLATDSVRIEYTLDGGATWTGDSLDIVARSDSRWGNYPWIVPALISDSVRFRVQEAGGAEVGISEMFRINAVHARRYEFVVPNSFVAAGWNGDFVRFAHKLQGRLHLEIFDTNGRIREVHDFNTAKEAVIPMHSYHCGTYLIRITTDRERFAQQLIFAK
ncbi:MAG: hypothetical protein GF398_20770 [Chitinivibrionales bacterium]|nr:hypothetical protein [Chitinivibrionales bacterium]